MAISYPLPQPTGIGIASITLTPMNAVSTTQSPFTFHTQTFQHPGQQWVAAITIPRVRRDLAEEWIAFLMKLNGSVGTFELGDPVGQTPRGSAATTPGTPRVNGADQTGSELICDGGPASANGYLLAGDYISIGGTATKRLYKVLNDVDTDTSGNFTLDIWPSIQTAHGDDNFITTNGPKGIFRLSRNFSYNIDRLSKYGISFNAFSVI